LISGAWAKTVVPYVVPPFVPQTVGTERAVEQEYAQRFSAQPNKILRRILQIPSKEFGSEGPT
jgi:hypothetical protein